MVVYYYEHECHAKKLFCFLKMKVTVSTYMVRICLFLLYISFFAIKPGLMVHSHMPECHKKKNGWLC